VAGAQGPRQLGERQALEVSAGGSRRSDNGNLDPGDSIDRDHPRAGADERDLKIDLGGIDSIAHCLLATRPSHCGGRNRPHTSVARVPPRRVVMATCRQYSQAVDFSDWTSLGVRLGR
jgi:hypothetical protein